MNNNTPFPSSQFSITPQIKSLPSSSFFVWCCLYEHSSRKWHLPKLIWPEQRRRIRDYHC
uniref:Uncharacterized protein n=1 Tax=Manihot esculenta TaxID=3983 RepID=A0A2C9UIK3_MANES